MSALQVHLMSLKAQVNKNPSFMAFRRKFYFKDIDSIQHYFLHFWIPLEEVYYSKFDRDHFLSNKICIVNVQIHGRVSTPYIAYCFEQQLVCIAVLTKVYTLHIL